MLINDTADPKAWQQYFLANPIMQGLFDKADQNEMAAVPLILRERNNRGIINQEKRFCASPRMTNILGLCFLAFFETPGGEN